MPADGRRRARPHLGHDPLDLVRHRAAVGVAQHEHLGSGPLGGGEDGEGEARVPPVAVEEVLGVEKDPETGRTEVGDGVGRHGDRLVERGPQRLGDVKVGSLGDDAHDLGPRLDEMPERLVTGGLRARTARRAEGHMRRRLQAQLLGRPGEVLLVLRVCARPATFDVGDAQVVELLGYVQLVVDGERDALLLRAVPERRVVDVDGLREAPLS